MEVKVIVEKEDFMNRLTVTATVLICICVLVSACTKKEIHSQQVEYSAGEITMKGYLSYDKNQKGARPGILIVHEWWGQDDHVRSRAEMLAGLGYTALAIDMYGEGGNAANAAEAAELAKIITGNSDALKERFTAALDFLKNQEFVDPEQIAAIGYSFGGHVVLEMARQGADIDGVVSVYGGLTTKAPAEKGAVKAKMLMQHGEKDWYVTVQNVSAFKNEMKNADVIYEFIEYKGAEHGFANPDADQLKEEFKMHLGYSEESDTKSWADMQAFLNRIFR